MTDNPHNETTLRVALELSNSKWVLAFSDGRKIRIKRIEARDRRQFLEEVSLAKRKLGLPENTRVASCYEAGRDGFWIYRWLEAEGIRCLVVDPASIRVSRRHRRAKTDRLDAESLADLLNQHIAGERKVWSVLRVPTAEQEDELRLERERSRLVKERGAHRARIKSLLVLHGLTIRGTLRKLTAQKLEELRCWNGQPLPASLCDEIKRELLRLEQVEEQFRALEKARAHALREPETAGDNKAVKLQRLHGVGPVSAWTLGKEYFGWRTFNNRREVGALSGLTPTPYDSGGSRVEQGISKAGNPRIRRVMIELAWSWLRFQPNSALSQWYERRFGHGSKRMRRVGITALARKLLVALWKYVELDEVPEGALIR